MSILRTNQIQDTSTNVAANISGGTITTTKAIVDPAKPSFFAYGSSASWQSVTTGNVVTELDATAHNIGNHYDTSTGRFNVPTTGVYCFQFNLYIKQTSNSASWSLYHNSVQYQPASYPAIRVFRNDGEANDETIGCCWTFKYTAGDYLEIRSSGQTSEYVPARSFFSGFFVG